MSDIELPLRDLKRGDKVTVEATFSRTVGGVTEIFFEGVSVWLPTYKLERLLLTGIVNRIEHSKAMIKHFKECLEADETWLKRLETERDERR